MFLSYASQDAEAAKRICNALRAAGVEVWFDQSELRGGDAWDQSIRKQIKTCALFVPIISANTHAREEGYFRLEWKLAVDRSHLMTGTKAFLLPVVIDDTRDDDEHVPDKFREVQWTRLPGGETPPAFVERISRLLSPEPAHAPTGVRSPAAAAPHGATAAQPPAPSPPASRQTQRVPLLIAAIVVIGVGYFALDRFVLSKRGTDAAHTSVTSLSGIPTPIAIPEKSIAVLPFIDMSERKDQEYFADGMAEEIINLLVKVPELKVIGRTSSFQFKGKTDDLRKIGTTLGTVYVVEGSVRRAGDHIRVTAQLIDTHDGTHRWSETYDREATDALKVQDEIAATLVRALQLEVTSLIHLQGRALPKNSEVYDSYLRGLHALNRYDQQGYEEAVAHFKHALEVDPSFAPAAEQLARALTGLAAFGFLPPQTGYEQARAAAEAALKLDSTSALAHVILALVHLHYDWDWSAAERETRTAVTLAPTDPNVLFIAAQERLAMGKWNEALRFAYAVTTADPLFPAGYSVLGDVYAQLGRLAEAESALRRLLEISPTRVGAHNDLAYVLLMEGKTEVALAEEQRETPGGGQTAGLALMYFALHRTKDADAALARLEAEHSGDMAMSIADAYAFRGQKDQAFNWLDRAYAQKDNDLYGIKFDSLLKKNLEGDPRYKAFLRKMNLPE